MSNGAVIFSFVLGAAAGAAGAWYVLKTKYDKKYQEEVESLERIYARIAARDAEGESDHEPEVEDEVVESAADEREMSVRDYATALSEQGYTDYNDLSKAEPKKEEVANVKKPYVISPHDFGEIDDYDTVSLIYYADGVLTDDDYNIIEDVEGTVGKSALTHFGEYEDDSVFVRNDRLHNDYEILLDSRKYVDIKKRPYPYNTEE